MTRVIILEDTARKSGYPSDENNGPQYLADIDTLSEWCASNLVDILETHLHIDLAALRKVTYPLATRSELREDGFDEAEIDRMLAGGDRRAERPGNLLTNSSTLSMVSCLVSAKTRVHLHQHFSKT
jgi:hypothetical protein